MKSKKVKVIVNEQHSLQTNQVIMLNNEFNSDWEILKVPAKGWNKDEIEMIVDSWRDYDCVFISPVPLLVALLVAKSIQSGEFSVYLFHNDVRNKTEMSDGRIVTRLDPTGWKLIKVS